MASIPDIQSRGLNPGLMRGMKTNAHTPSLWTLSLGERVYMCVGTCVKVNTWAYVLLVCEPVESVECPSFLATVYLVFLRAGLSLA